MPRKPSAHYLEMTRFELVIFDCDGVLVDSERIANQVFCAMLNELGVSVTLQDMFEHFVGLSMPQCMALVTRMYGKPPRDTFVPELQQRTAAALTEQIKPVAGVTETLAALTIPYCAASSGDHAKIRLTLGLTGLLQHFEGRIFSVVDVENPKPAPDVFLLAARTFGIHPSRCAVVEDTPTGVRAGVAAGMYVLGFSASTPEYRLRDAGAHEVFSEMRRLPELLNAAQSGVAGGVR